MESLDTNPTPLTGIRKARCRRVRVCDYVYKDIWGAEQFLKIRYKHEPCIAECGRGKSFEYAWRPDRDKRWDLARWKPPWADGYLYRLDEWWLDVWRGRIEEVWWAEGEKDADALRSVHLPATSHHQGAGNANLAQALWLVRTGQKARGVRRVVLVADLDDAGAYCAITRNNLLSEAGYAGEVRIVRAAVGKDAADHLAARCRPAEFVSVDLNGLRDSAHRHLAKLKRGRGNGYTF